MPPSAYLSLAALTIAFVLAILFAYRYYRLEQEEKEEVPESPEALLADFERAYYSGEMDEEEFRRIKDSLRKQSDPTATPGPKPAPRPGAAPTEQPGPAESGVEDV